MNTKLEQQIIDLLHQMSDDELHQVIHFIEKNKIANTSKNGLGTLLHQQFKASGLVDAGSVLPERSLEAERAKFYLV